MKDTNTIDQAHRESGARRGTLAVWLAFACIAGLAVLIRFYRLADMPPGFHYDEAFNGLDTYRLLSTPLSQWPLFFSGNFGREPLFNYLMTIAQMATGPSALTMRFMAALVGVLLTPALAWLAWECAPSLGCDRRRLSLWAGVAILAVLWSQIYARYVLRVEFFALLETLFLAALWRGWRLGRARWFVLAGVTGGLAFYTYLPVRLLPAVFVLPGLALLLQRRGRGGRSDLDQPAVSRARLRGLLLTCMVAMIVMAPLAGYFVRHPADFSQRLSQVSLLQRPQELLHNVGAVAGMFFISGDTNPRNNIPGRPALDWLMAAPFLIGLLYVLRRGLRPAHLLLLSWFGVMLLPTLLSEYAPSFQRAIGALPPIALFVAIGLDRVAGWLIARWPSARTAITVALSLYLLAGVAITWQAFRSWSADPEIFFARDAGFTELAGQLAGDDEQISYLSPRGSDHPTLSFLLAVSGVETALRGFDGRTCVRISDAPATRYVFLDQEDSRGPALVRTYLPDAAERTLVADPYGRTWASELIQPAGGRIVFPEMQADPVAWEGGPQLLGYWLSSESLEPGSRLYVRLFWRRGGRALGDLTTFVHLLDNPPASGGKVLAGSDSRPGRGSCATTSWQEDEVVVDELEFEVPANLPGSGMHLEIGLYDTATQARLPLADRSSDVTVIGPLPR